MEKGEKTAFWEFLADFLYEHEDISIQFECPGPCFHALHIFMINLTGKIRTDYWLDRNELKTSKDFDASMKVIIEHMYQELREYMEHKEYKHDIKL